MVLTSNRTRELHEALRRRCVYHWIGYPDAEREARIVMMRASVAGATAEPWSAPSAGCGRSRCRSRRAWPKRSNGPRPRPCCTRRRALAGRLPPRHRRRAQGPGRPRLPSGPARRDIAESARERRSPSLPRAASRSSISSRCCAPRLRGRARADEVFIAAVGLLGRASSRIFAGPAWRRWRPRPSAAAVDALFRLVFLGRGAGPCRRAKRTRACASEERGRGRAARAPRSASIGQAATRASRSSCAVPPDRPARCAAPLRARPRPGCRAAEL